MTLTKLSHRARGLAAAAACVVSSLAAPALAWDASVSAPSMGVDFLVGSWSGSWTWTPLREGVSTTYGLNESIPNDFVFQAWDGSAWPDAEFRGELVPPGGGNAVAYFSHDDVSETVPYSAEAFVTGLAPGVSAGSQFAYDFSFTLAPFSQATITYFDDYALAQLESSATDTGVGFAGLKLYAPALDINAPGGANQAYFDRYLSLNAGPGASVSGTLSNMEYTFTNASAAPVSHELRLQGYVLVFTTPVPEPAAHALLLAGLVAIGWRQRRRMRAGA